MSLPMASLIAVSVEFAALARAARKLVGLGGVVEAGLELLGGLAEGAAEFVGVGGGLGEGVRLAVEFGEEFADRGRVLGVGVLVDDARGEEDVGSTTWPAGWRLEAWIRSAIGGWLWSSCFAWARSSCVGLPVSAIGVSAMGGNAAVRGWCECGGHDCAAGRRAVAPWV